ncbi:MAG: hypothetical protein H6822_21110 [Planctomycetaceae bacterium]|nr:hypothetical protein [Planctomycetales bacterium]MCB9924693.1 hypothetical protein [Planctomycetaceae bacterium]
MTTHPDKPKLWQLGTKEILLSVVLLAVVANHHRPHGMTAVARGIALTMLTIAVVALAHWIQQKQR